MSQVYPEVCDSVITWSAWPVQVRRKCETGAYAGPEDFAADMRQVFANAHTYNKAGTDVYVMATTLAVRCLACRLGWRVHQPPAVLCFAAS